MLPNECYETFIRACEKSSGTGYKVFLKKLIEELERQVTTQKYDASKVVALVNQTRTNYINFTYKYGGDKLLTWLAQEWPKAVDQARLVSQSPTQAPPVTRSPQPVTCSLFDVEELMKPLFGKWKMIKVTDLPTNRPGVYTSVGGDVQTSNLRLLAAGRVKRELNVDEKEAPCQPGYWIEIGRMASVHKEGRCFSCAGIAVYDLVLSPAFDDFTIYVASTKTYDHHYVLLTRDKKMYFAVDIWHSNVNAKTNNKLPYVSAWENFPYKSGSKKTCKLSRTKRKVHRAFAMQGRGV